MTQVVRRSRQARRIRDFALRTDCVLAAEDHDLTTADDLLAASDRLAALVAHVVGEDDGIDAVAARLLTQHVAARLRRAG